MFRHAMIAVDLASEVPLLECAPDLARWGVEEVTLVHLLKVGYAEGPGHGEEARRREALGARAAPLVARGMRVNVDVGTAGDVGGALAERAEQVDLLVVGNRSHNVLERLFLGSVARKALRRARVPVLVHWIALVDGEARCCVLGCADTLRPVLAATDLRASARPVHDVAVALAARAARVDVVHVSTAHDEDRFADWPVMARAALADVERRIAEAGGTGEGVLERGEPDERVLEGARARDASLLIVGKVGRSRDARMGRTARALSKQACRPVLMVPNR